MITMNTKGFKTIIFTAFISFFILYGCDGFLDTTPTDKICNENLFKTTGLAQTVLDGTYRLMREESRNDLKTFDLRLDMVDGRDMMMNKSGFFSGDYDLGIDKPLRIWAKFRICGICITA